VDSAAVRLGAAGVVVGDGSVLPAFCRVWRVADGV